MTGDASIPLNLEALATAAGTSVPEVKRLIAVGLINDSENFEAADVSRVRLVNALEAVGISTELLVTAARQGAVSFDFVDLLMPDAIPLTTETQAELAHRSDLPAGLQKAVKAILGTLSASDEEHIRSDDARVMEIVKRSQEMGASDEQVARIVRVTADMAHRLVDAQRDFVDEVILEPVLRGGSSEQDAVHRTASLRREYRDLGITLFEILYRRSVEVAVFQNVVEMIQMGLAREGLSPPVTDVLPAIAFVDVSGFTRTTEERGDVVAAELASTFAGFVQELAAVHDGVVVKLLGDGAMVRFPDATRAVRTMLALRRHATSRGLPTVHSGIDAGPVVHRDGDVFGTVVNLAARASAHAGSDEVLVTEAVVKEWKGSDVSFQEVGEVQLRGLMRPVRLFQAF